ncbi:MAG TPA: sigma-54 dependent transcriptional regulator [Gemmataceae bacterium]
MPTLLVVDDEPNVLYSMQKSLQGQDLEVRTARTGREGVRCVEQGRPDAVILDVRLPDMNGLEAFDQIRAVDPRLPVIVITAFAATETAIEAMKRGAFEYLLKPLDLHQLRDVVAKAVEMSRLRQVPALIDGGAAEDPADPRGGDGDRTDRIVGRSPVMQEVYKAVGRVASQDVPVLIVGESGTGKELVARAIYHHSHRSGAPFLAINCAAIPESLLESELFGHERGAFTGADRRRIGKFEQCNGGTLFLDEIGDMTPATQAKVLRLLQDQRFERLGGNETIQTDVRILAASNQNLESLVRQGRFRADLLYRLNVFTIHLPPLRERREDLPLLIEYYLQRANRSLDKRVRTIAPETLEILARHTWPGNVRELQSVIKYALVQAVGDVLTPACLPENLRGIADPGPRADAARADAPPGGSPPDARGPKAESELARLVADMLRNGETDIYRKAELYFDRVVLEAVFRHVKGNQVQASELLGISRTTLRAKLRMLGLAVEKQVAEADPPVSGEPRPDNGPAAGPGG